MKTTKKKNSGNSNNPFRHNKPESKLSGKRIGKSRPEKANNQLNRRVKK